MSTPDRGDLPLPDSDHLPAGAALSTASAPCAPRRSRGS